MSIENEVVTAPKVVEAPAAAPVAAPTPEVTPEKVEVAPATPTPEVAPPAAYQPNLKFKVMDKEHEIDAFLKDAIKDAEMEKKVRELYEKAIGLDYAKPKHEELKGQYNQFTQGFQTLGGLVQQNRLQEFFDFWKLPKEKVYEFVASQLRYEDLPPEQKAEEDRKRTLETRARQAEEQSQQILSEHQNYLADVRKRDLETAISRPDISQVAQEYDTRVGKPGAFRMEVIRRGRLAAFETKKDISVDQALDEVMTSLGYVQESQPGTAAPLPIVSTVAQKKLPVLPNLGSGGASPVKKSMSLADLRAAAKAMRN